MMTRLAREKGTEYYKRNLIQLETFLMGHVEHKTVKHTKAYVQDKQACDHAEHVPLISFNQPSKRTDDFLLRISQFSEELGALAPKLEQILKLNQFRLKHFKRFQQLTEREVQVLRLLANGHNNPQIAGELFLSRATVETHRKRLKRKLQLRSFRDLMRYAFAFNLVEI